MTQDISIHVAFGLMIALVAVQAASILGLVAVEVVTLLPAIMALAVFIHIRNKRVQA